MGETWALAAKDIKLLLRDRLGAFFTFIFPLVFAAFFGYINSGFSRGESSMKVALVDEDQSEESRAFIADLMNQDKTPELRADVLGREEAANKVRLGDRAAFIVIPKGFGEAKRDPYRIFSGEPITLETGIDPSRKAEGGMLQGILTKKLFEGLADSFSFSGPEQKERFRKLTQDSLKQVMEDAGMDPAWKLALTPFLTSLDQFAQAAPLGENEEPKNEPNAEKNASPAASENEEGFNPFEIRSVDIARRKIGFDTTYDFTFPQGVMWGIVGCVNSFVISLAQERSKGTLLRLRMSPMSQLQILGGKGLACFVTTVLVSCGLMAIAILVFGVSPDSYPLLALGIGCTAFGFVGIMMLLSTLGKTERAAAGFGWAAMMLFSMIGGGMIPLFAMPPFMQTMSNISPIKWGVLAFEGAIWRGYSFTEMLLPCGILVAIGAVCLAIGVRSFRWSES